MGIGVSLILIAAGAILTWAVNATVSGIDINAIGVIPWSSAVVGLVLSLVFWSIGWRSARLAAARPTSRMGPRSKKTERVTRAPGGAPGGAPRLNR
jgi:hypothetical protein